jgi:hypothetical protein
MKHSQPVDRVVDLLGTAGYRKCEVPFVVASMPFEFAAVLAASPRALDLVVVIDTLTEPESRIRQKVEGLSRALDLVASRRPLTTVLVGPPPRASVANVISRVCRVLQVGTPTGDGAEHFLRDALAVLLPLELPDVNETIADPLGEVRRRLQAGEHKEEIAGILHAAVEGPEAVKNSLRKLLCEPLNPPGTEHL